MTFTIKVYKLTNTINNSFYVGSTKERLCKRMGEHRTKSRQNRMSKLYRAMQAVGVEHWQITLIEAFEVSTFEEQRQREREVMERLNPDLNERYAYRSPAENIAYYTAYYQENKNEIKQYNQENKNEKKQYNAAYYRENIAYYAAYKERNKSRHKCECCRIATHSKVKHNRHMQTAKHQRNEAASLFRELPFY